jgi:hypothetical protein
MYESQIVANTSFITGAWTSWFQFGDENQVQIDECAEIID